MRSVQFVILFALFCSTAAAEQTVEYDWLTQGKVSGRLELVIHDDGERSAHFEFNDRGRGPSLDERYRVGADGLIKFYETHGRAYMGAPVDERFVFEDGSARWKSELESGRAEGGLDAFYLANDATPEQTAALARALLAATDRTLRLWPSGTARVEQLAEVVVKHESQSVEANLFAIFGLGFGPGYVWLDEDRELFAISSGGMGLTRAGWRDVLPALAQRQRAAEQAHFRQLASELTHQTPAALCLKNFSVLDVDGGRTMPASTVRIEDGVITAVGADDSIDCKGLATIDGNGQTLLPGLWDMHVHTSADDGPLHLAAGVTSVRDLGNDHDDLTAVIEQFEQGRAMGPTVYRAGFIDAAGPFAAPSDNLATSLDEAMAYIEQLDTQGYRHIKIYSSIAPEWVAPMADEMHRRGIRLSGHVPSGMSTAKAIRDGFDEIQHINMLFLNFLAGPEDDTRTPLRFSLVAEGAGGLDLGSPEVSEFIALLDAEDIVVDPTVAIFDNMFRHRTGEISPSYAAIADHLPTNVRRGMLAGRMDINEDNAARYAASAQALLAMIRRLHEAGVPLVPGTDALPGFTLHRELELYVEAGIPNADVLRIATAGAAHVLGMDDSVGRIAPGYAADLIALDGNPLDDIGAIRNTTMTLKGRRLYQPAALHRALGIQPFAEPLPPPDVRP
ncbi:MAG: amidohydrolase [Xanthomonadales bacterium]|nr:amidohydrolase [Xanthomonadales bacterium]